MTQMLKKIDKAFALIDQYNQGDPNLMNWEGQTYPREFFYSLRVYEWVRRLHSKPEETLLLAARGQHIGRWEIPRSAYPMNKAGYLNWRSTLSRYHAEKTLNILAEVEYPEETAERVKTIILKTNIKQDADVQTMEDALCLVFLQYQFAEFSAEHEDEKVIRILQKTWNKMSKAGHDAALQLPYGERELALIQRALGE